jgi:hypothetical protein
MKPLQILKQLKTLSQTDTKTTDQKILKINEELGELSRAQLAKSCASGSIHKFVRTKDVIEEAVDTALAALSVAYDVADGDDEAIENMFIAKLNKWHGIQARESEININNIPFEIHVTVMLPPGADAPWISLFSDVCGEMKVKPILLNLLTDSTVHKDIMTSSTHFGNNYSAYQAMKSISDTLRGHGYVVLREKIETVPWHPAAPQNDGTQFKPGCYFESHLGIVTTDKTFNKLREIANSIPNAHLSRNAFKSLDEDSYIMMLTIRRSDCGFATFRNDLDETIARS